MCSKDAANAVASSSNPPDNSDKGAKPKKNNKFKKKSSKGNAQSTLPQVSYVDGNYSDDDSSDVSTLERDIDMMIFFDRLLFSLHTLHSLFNVAYNSVFKTTIHDNPIHTASPSFISMLKVSLVASIFCLFKNEITCTTFSANRSLADRQTTSALPIKNEVISNVTATLSDLAAENFSTYSFQRCKIKSFSFMMNIEFSMTLTQAADSATDKSISWRHGSAVMTISLLDGDSRFELQYPY